MSKSVEEFFKNAPEDATHYAKNCHYKVIGDTWMVYISDNEWVKSDSMYNGQIKPSDIIQRPQPKPWSGPEDGLPPVGLECEVDHGNGKHWDKVTIVAHHCEKAIYLDPVREIHYIWGLVKDFRTVRTPDQIASDARETAIRELMDIAGVDCRVTAARLVDAGFKR